MNDFDRELKQNKIIVLIYLYMVLELTDSFWGCYFILSVLNRDELFEDQISRGDGGPLPGCRGREKMKQNSL